MTDLDPAGDPVAIGILLTDAEHAVIRQAGDLWGAICSAVADGPTRDADLRELIAHVHAIQHAVMAQAASRAYPDLYRPLGSIIPSPTDWPEGCRCTLDGETGVRRTHGCPHHSPTLQGSG